MTYRLSKPGTTLDTTALRDRMVQQRQRRAAPRHQSPDDRSLARPGEHRQGLPARLALHLLVGLLVPLAAVGGPLLQRGPAPAVVAPYVAQPPGDLALPVAPLSLNAQGDLPVPDSAFAAIDALSSANFDPRLMQLEPVQSSVAVEAATVRAGPGTEYDPTGKLAQNSALLVLARHGDWLKAQAADGAIVWVASELLAIDSTAMNLLPEATDIPAPPPAKVGTVAESNLNLRDGPGTDFVGMVKLDPGTKLDLLAHYGEWLQVQTADGRSGWVLGQHVQLAPGVLERIESVQTIPAAHPDLVGTASENNVTLRGGPGTGYGKLAALGDGSALDLLGRYGDWYKVRAPGGTIGWISVELTSVDAFIQRRVPQTRDIPALPQPLVRPVPQAAKPAAPAKPAPQIQVPLAPAVNGGGAAGYAMQFVGSRYAWGGEGPGGFDCSGLTRFVYRQFGLNMPHSAAGQFNTAYGTVVSNPADLQPGDLVFFANTYTRGISHVGIYVGGGNVVQALTPGLGVGVANLSGGYWQAHYYAGLRPRI